MRQSNGMECRFDIKGYWRYVVEKGVMFFHSFIFS